MLNVSDQIQSAHVAGKLRARLDTIERRMARKKLSRKLSKTLLKGEGPRSASAPTHRVPDARILPLAADVAASRPRSRDAAVRPSLRRHDLTEQQWRILRALAAIDTIEVTELARVAFLLARACRGYCATSKRAG